jgi:ABC-type phosphate transport system substrate-binding protein
MLRVFSVVVSALLSCLVAGFADAQAVKPSGAGGSDARVALVDQSLRPLIAGSAGVSSWIPAEGARAMERLCEPGNDVRVAFTTTRIDQPSCRQAGRTVLFQKAIGWVVVVAVAQPGGAFNLTSLQMFKALAAPTEGPKAARPTKWSDVDPTLPDSAIRFLLPAAGSLEERALLLAVARGCSAARGVKEPPAGVSPPAPSCGSLRNDAAVARAQPGQMASAWLKSAGPGAVAFVGYGQLAADGDLIGVMPLDGRMASSAALLAREYPAALIVYALASRSSGSSDSRREAVVPLADALLSEGAIGPYGNVASRGLAPLPAQERVAVRNAFGQFLTNTGVWE